MAKVFDAITADDISDAAIWPGGQMQLAMDENGTGTASVSWRETPDDPWCPITGASTGPGSIIAYLAPGEFQVTAAGVTGATSVYVSKLPRSERA